MVIQIDSRQKMNKKHHKIKEQWFIDHGHEIVRSKCLVGDYVCPSRGSVAVDTKQHCGELYSDLIQDHKRFRDECINAQRYGIKLYILVEDEHGMKEPKDILKWRNPRMLLYFKQKKIAERNGTAPPKPPASNVQLLKIMNSMSRDYGVTFMFCRTEEAGQIIVELLGGDL